MKLIPKMTGYKATNKDMQCCPDNTVFQFELGKWYEIDGDLELCKNGFHFCEQPSGPWTYYSAEGTRVFKVEAEDVLDQPFEPGAGFKRVCRRIRLVEEIIPDSKGNTGYRNTGYRNTGDQNTGNGNTGDRNTGDRNTGDRNTGYRNTGDQNTGYWNTGDQNTGNGNTGDQNTGDRNTGYRNTGDQNTGNGNTGDRNTGSGNATNRSAGFCCCFEPKLISFDVQTNLSEEEFYEKFPHAVDLLYALACDSPIIFALYSDIPGITPEKLKELHSRHIAARKRQCEKQS